MNLTARILHNVGPSMLWRYHPGVSELFHAHDFEVVADNIEKAADLVWTLANVDDANHLTSMRPDLGHYGPQVTAYRQRRNRSLSAGDVIVFHEGDRFVGTMAVEPVGHKHYPDVPPHEEGSNDEPISKSYEAFQRLLDEQNN